MNRGNSRDSIILIVEILLFNSDAKKQTKKTHVDRVLLLKEEEELLAHL